MVLLETSRHEMTLRILIAEDSALFATVLQELLASARDIEVVGLADDGEEAVRMCQALGPDLILMDIQMPKLDGLSATERIMALVPTPILIVTSDPYRDGVDMTFQALKAGALDLIPKPTQLPMPLPQHEEFVRKVRLLAEIPVIRHVRGRERLRQSPSPAARGQVTRQARRQATTHAKHRGKRPSSQSAYASTSFSVEPSSGAKRRTSKFLPVVAIAASTGGPKALAQLLGDLPVDFGASILVVQHITSGFSAHLARWLNAHSLLQVQEAAVGSILEPNHVYIAPSGAHMTLSSHKLLRVQEGTPVSGHCPSGDLLLKSVAEHMHSRCIGIILSGMGQDGAKGLVSMHEAGGQTMVQDKESSVVYGMPQSAIDLGVVDEVVDITEMARILCLRLQQLQEGVAG